MPIAFECGACKYELRALDHNAGRVLRCPKCKGEFTVPALGMGNPPARYVERVSTKYPDIQRPAAPAPTAPVAPAAPFAPVDPAAPLEPTFGEPAPLEPLEPAFGEPAPLAPLEPAFGEPAPFAPAAAGEPTPLAALETPFDLSASADAGAPAAGQELELTPEMLVDEAAPALDASAVDQLFAEVQQETAAAGDAAPIEAVEEVSVVDEGDIVVEEATEDTAIVEEAPAEDIAVIEEAPTEDIVVVEEEPAPPKKKKK